LRIFKITKPTTYWYLTTATYSLTSFMIFWCFWGGSGFLKRYISHPFLLTKATPLTCTLPTWVLHLLTLYLTVFIFVGLLWIFLNKINFVFKLKCFTTWPFLRILIFYFIQPPVKFSLFWLNTLFRFNFFSSDVLSC